MLAIAVAALVPLSVWWSARRARETALAAGATLLWLVVTYAAAALGALHFSPPPTMLVLFVGVFAIALSLSLSPVGYRIATQLPLAALVGFQGFRVLVELL